MYRSKALKRGHYNSWWKVKKYEGIVKYFSVAYDFLRIKIYYAIHKFFQIKKERIERSIDFARFGWLNHDWDSVYLFYLMEWKLKRMTIALKEGHAIQSDEVMASIKEATKICERLSKQNYEDKYFEAHDKKWGRSIGKSTPEYDEKGNIKFYNYKTSRKNVKTKLQKEKESKEFMHCIELGDRDRRSDIDRLCVILKDHERSWWD